jgi:NAD(P)H-dependent FMN reductase
MPLNTAVIYGSVRRDRQGIRAARFVVKKLQAIGHDVSLVDAKEYPLPILDLRYSEYEDGSAPEPMQKIHEMLDAADGFIVVSGEYNHGIPPGLKNLLDHFLPQYKRKPSAIASYSTGAFAGARVHTSLREVLSTLGTIPVPPTLLISSISTSFDEDGNALDQTYEERADKFFAEYEWYAKALQAART